MYFSTTCCLGRIELQPPVRSPSLHPRPCSSHNSSPRRALSLIRFTSPSEPDSMRQPFFSGKQMESFSLYTANVLLAAIAYCADRFHRFPFSSAAQVLADLSAAKAFSTAPSPPGISAQYHPNCPFCDCKSVFCKV